MDPIIGVTSSRRMLGSVAGETQAHVTYTTYTEMVQHAGGVPLVLVPVDRLRVGDVLDRIDGLVLSGGGDIDPTLYGGEMVDTLDRVDPTRDEFEIALAAEAERRRFPTLAICRGMQVMNVALGGTLVEDIPTRIDGALDHNHHGSKVFEPQHTVTVAAETRTADAIGGTQIPVNAIHHQAVKTIGRGLVATAWADDGVVEAMEPADQAWQLWCVQWHPEFLGHDDEPSMRLFTTFIDAVRASTG